MQTSNQNNEILDKILNSKSFISSPTSKALLKFLVQATLDNVDVKESVIGMHIYGDRYDGEKSNARIRVSIFHLRKRLEQYYENEGSNDDIKLTIAKGQYQVSFSNEKNTPRRSVSKYKIHLVYALVIFIMLAATALYHIKPNIPIWKSLLKNNKETVMYIGDVYGYMGRTPTGGWGWQRDYAVNSAEEFLQKKTELSLTDEEVVSANYSYVTSSEVDAVKKISRLFYEQKKDFSVRLASKIDVKDLKEQNIIYAGPIKTNNRFIQLLAENFTQFKYQDDMLLLRDANSRSFQSITDKYSKELKANNPSEIAIVAKIQGTHNTQQFLFFSDHDMGVRATVDFFSNTDSLKRFENTYLKDKLNFSAIFIVKGKERVDLGIKLLDVY